MFSYLLEMRFKVLLNFLCCACKEWKKSSCAIVRTWIEYFHMKREARWLYFANNDDQINILDTNLITFASLTRSLLPCDLQELSTLQLYQAPVQHQLLDFLAIPTKFYWVHCEFSALRRSFLPDWNLHRNKLRWLCRNAWNYSTRNFAGCE